MLLAQRLEPGRPDTWRVPLALQLARLPEALRKRYADAPDFWDGAALADLDLVRLLDHCLASAPPAGKRTRQADTLPAECATLAAQVGAGYRRVIGRGASPRERASVIENLDCLIALLGSDLPALRKALAEIRDAL
ncbi:MAG: hypothetical protein ACYCWL_14940 [Thauera sp.]